jgi:hypothetical protein
VRTVKPATACSSLGAVLGLGTVAEREVYAALDWLVAQQPGIEAGLARRHLNDGMLVLYDVSSSYFEGRKCPLARFGYSRDHRADRPQIVYGLFCTRDGLPVAVEVFDGDTADPATLGRQILKLRARFGFNQVLAGRRPWRDHHPIRDDLRPAGLDWISCLRAPQIQVLAAEGGPLQLSLFDERDRGTRSVPRRAADRLPQPAAGRGTRPQARGLLVATERDLSRIKLTVERKRMPLRGKA